LFPLHDLLDDPIPFSRWGGFPDGEGLRLFFDVDDLPILANQVSQPRM